MASVSVEHLPPISNLPPRTVEVHEALLRLATEARLEATLEELSAALGMTRQTLHTHLARLRAARLLTELEMRTRSDGSRVRVREVHATPLTPVLYSRPIHTYMETTQQNPIPKGTRSPGTPPLRRGSAAAPGELARSASAAGLELTQLMAGGNEARAVDLRHLPPYPSAARFPPAVMPRMPAMTGNPAADAKLLIRAYKAAVYKVYGRRPRVDKNAAFRMRPAVSALMKACVRSPYAWAAFRMSTWAHSPRADKERPSIDYVFSAKVVEQHAEHFAARAGALDVLRRVVVTPSHAELLEAWEACRRAAACPSAGPPGEQGTRQVVRRLLPRSRYAALASRVEAERTAMEAAWYQRLAAGEWIW